MRGKVSFRLFYGSVLRITPAYAGKSFKITCYNVPNEDHPRLCGEKVPKVLLMLANIGSPPPMRGKVTFLIDTVFPARITPAYAGKSPSDGLLFCHVLDHPRLCGEKHVFPAVAVFVLGSPPPMRGKGSITRNVT